jgi:hypothetical protein
VNSTLVSSALSSQSRRNPYEVLRESARSRLVASTAPCRSTIARNSAELYLPCRRVKPVRTYCKRSGSEMVSAGSVDVGPGVVEEFAAGVASEVVVAPRPTGASPEDGPEGWLIVVAPHADAASTGGSGGVQTGVVGRHSQDRVVEPAGGASRNHPILPSECGRPSALVERLPPWPTAARTAESLAVAALRRGRFATDEL